MRDNYDPTYILHHLGEERFPSGAVSPPIFQTSNFSFEDFDELRAALADEQAHFLYSRGNNPTVNLVEQKIAALEGAARAKLVSSGVSAISAAIMGFVSAGDHVVCVEDSYVWARRLLESYLARFRVEHTFVDGRSVEECAAAIRPSTRLIYLESPTSLTFKLQDVQAIAALARSRGIKTVIDNTWATPIYMNPIELGVDLVVHSVSKYLGGHSDVVAGVVAGSAADIEHIFTTEFLQLGTVPDPLMAWLVLRGLRTLAVRMPAHYASALKVAGYLQNHAAVESVIYPPLPSHPQHDLAKRQMRGGGSLFAFRLKSRKVEEVKLFVNSLKIFRRAVSWGGYESLIMPDAVHHRGEGPSERVSLVRLYVGLEDAELLTADLEQALARIL